MVKDEAEIAAEIAATAAREAKKKEEKEKNNSENVSENKSTKDDEVVETSSNNVPIEIINNGKEDSTEENNKNIPEINEEINKEDTKDSEEIKDL